VVREVTPDHLARMRETAEIYVERWQRYRRELRPEDD
jgi:hypothetical protein